MQLGSASATPLSSALSSLNGLASSGGTSSSSTSSSSSSTSSSAASTSANSLASIGAALSNAVTTNVSTASVVHENESLTLALKDGTQVTFKMGANGKASGSAQTNADGSSSMTASQSSSSQIQVSVSGGTLSSDDLKAIGDVVSQVDSLTSRFFSGNVQDAFAAAASLKADATQIAGLSLKLTYSAASATVATASTDSAAQSPSPQQIIINFMQQAVTKLSRNSDNSAQLNDSPKWKLQLLASALPAYAKTLDSHAQAAAGSQPAPTVPAAKLAADALKQLAS
jgi:hypothetical protein